MKTAKSYLYDCFVEQDTERATIFIGYMANEIVAVIQAYCDL